ncbi:DUF4249 domain-containing protein [Hymenobacter sp. BT683]|uniref:DUF4249 domain-containing protein n=1 Tax=Hymenobacter jeongseonensis TaxID=2791027 RepID=A0ABS0ICG3_9BACT|nr:DUF4249 domain-containing protein [Hymenobacter jeongseonensis]MBF9235857.1 DUF4249 domain-containing protein [Hymenobacter jeongseonensis]
MRTFPLSIGRSLIWCLALLMGCTDSYLPEALESPPNYLVVDGFLNAQGVTTVRLSRTYAVDSKAVAPAELRANAFIEDEAGARLGLREGVAGAYVSAPLVLDPAKKYRLRVLTQAGQDYASEFVPVKLTPPIDAVAWRATPEGVDVLVDTHDDQNASQYYRWDYEETWEINPPYRPNVEYVNGQMRDIVVPYPTICWGSALSTAIQIDKTTALSQDVVSGFRVRRLARTSERLTSRYSVLVQQHALTKEEYAYWELLRKNTESLGSLFDPQPAQLTGNVRCLSAPDQLALGFVSAHSCTEKRLFIARQELPQEWDVRTGYEGCLPPDTVYIDRPNPPIPNPVVILYGAFNPLSGNLPIEPVYGPGPVLQGYTAKSRDCIDCRTRGTTVRPTFW